MSSLSDAEQLDQLKSATKKYGSAVISGILIALIAFFGWEYWQKNNLAKAQNETARVQQLMNDAQSTAGQADAWTKLSTSADAIMKDDAHSAQAIQTQFLMAKIAYDQGNYANAEKALQKIANAEQKDKGLVQLAKLRLSYSQLAQNKYDAALKTLVNVTDPAFKATAEEAKGDIYVAKNDVANAQKAYQAAWNDLIARKQERQILQIKLESVGILVDDPEIERPVLDVQADES